MLTLRGNVSKHHRLSMATKLKLVPATGIYKAKQEFAGEWVMKSSARYVLVVSLAVVAATAVTNARPVQPINRRFVIAPLASQ